MRSSGFGAGPVISIVTPSLNQGRFLEATIRSVLDQGYEALQYIVQDGGSSDESVTVLERYTSRLHHWESAPDSGHAEAINAGFRHATGDVMAWLNADDILLPGCLDVVGRYFAGHPDVDVIYSHRVVIDDHGSDIGRWVLPRHDDRTLLWADYVPQETLFWTRRIWGRAGRRIDESFKFSMDWELLLRFMTVGARFARIPRFLGAFRVHETQKTSKDIGTVGEREMRLLRERCHGRVIEQDEVVRNLRLFVLRHFVYDRLYHAHVLRY